MNWRSIMQAEPPTQYSHYSQNKQTHADSEDCEDNEHWNDTPSDTVDYYTERAGILQYEGECPAELADYVARLETLSWWLRQQHPEINAQWVLIAMTLR